MIFIVIVYGKIRDKKEVKRKIKRRVICPECKKEVKLGIEEKELSEINKFVSLPHLFLHGDPLHAIICYVNSELKTKNIGVIKSIEISRDSETFTQLLNKWTNPY